jgi:hypothetical protein
MTSPAVQHDGAEGLWHQPERVHVLPLSKGKEFSYKVFQTGTETRGDEGGLSPPYGLDFMKNTVH